MQVTPSPPSSECGNPGSKTEVEGHGHPVEKGQSQGKPRPGASPAGVLTSPAPPPKTPLGSQCAPGEKAPGFSGEPAVTRKGITWVPHFLLVLCMCHCSLDPSQSIRAAGRGAWSSGWRVEAPSTHTRAQASMHANIYTQACTHRIHISTYMCAGTRHTPPSGYSSPSSSLARETSLTETSLLPRGPKAPTCWPSPTQGLSSDFAHPLEPPTVGPSVLNRCLFSGRFSG